MPSPLPELVPAFQPPGYARAEITGDRRFTGGRLATARREDLVSWLAQYGISAPGV
jgi:hypothetical protein